MASNLFFYVAISFILAHEMDAIRCREWRIFPGLALLGDRMGYRLFLFLHLPLFVALLYGLSVSPHESLIFSLNIFFIVHFFLHLAFLFHPKNEFKDWTSWTIISGAAISAVLDLML